MLKEIKREVHKIVVDEQSLASLIQKSRISLMKQLTAGIAHELRNPLAVIRLEAGLLAEKFSSLAEETRNEFQPHLSIMEHNITQMSEIIDQVRRLAKKDSDHYEKIDIHNILMNVEKQALRLINREKIRLVIDMKATDPSFYGNRTNIEQVFLNLITNASDAIILSNKGSQISIRTHSSDEKVFVDVEDNGSGIEAKNIPAIFDPFFTTKEGEQGIGLGLSIVAQIVTSHGGEIEVESELGQGTRFRFWIPHDRRAYSRKRKELSS